MNALHNTAIGDLGSVQPVRRDPLELESQEDVATVAALRVALDRARLSGRPGVFGWRCAWLGREVRWAEAEWIVAQAYPAPPAPRKPRAPTKMQSYFRSVPIPTHRPWQAAT